MLQQPAFDYFCKELVEDGQNGGQSMHSIYKSEIAHFHGVKSGALQAAVRKSLIGDGNGDVSLTLRALENYPNTGDLQGRLAQRVPLNGRKGLVDFGIGHLPPGLYTASLVLAGHRLATTKLSIVR